MDQKPTPKSTMPVQETSPEEDATLLAIEALEARSVDPNPRPLNAPREIAVPERKVPTAPVPTPKPHLRPIASPPTPKPLIPADNRSMPTKQVLPTRPLAAVIADIAPIAPPKPKKPLTPAEEMAEELAHAPVMTPFQFFLRQKASRKSFIVAGIILLLVGLGAAVYFVIR